MRVAPLVGSGLPYLGNALAFNRNPVAFLQRAQSQHGDVFRFRLLGQTVYALLSAEGKEAFFRADDEVLDPRDAYRFTVPIFGPGVAYDVAPELMEQQLRLLHPALRDTAMQSYASIMSDEVRLFIERLGDSGDIDVPAALNELTIFIAGRCLLGDEFRGRLSTEFAALYKDLEGGINLIAFVAPNAPTPRNIRRDRARRRVAQIVSGLITQRRQKSIVGDDFLGVLLSAQYESGATLSEEAITGLLLTVLFAGQHTSSVMATWLGVLLMNYPDYCKSVREEAHIALESGVTLAGIKRMQIMERCLKEAERLHPPLVMLMRRTQKPFFVGDLTIAPGNLVMVSPGVSHRDPRVFDTPEIFDPERYSASRSEDRKPYALFGFGGGHHRCLGMAFAHQQIKVIWGMLLRHYDFRLRDNPASPDYTTFVVGPRHPCRASYQRRAP